MKQLRIVISHKHPYGAVWMFLPGGWHYIPGTINELGLQIDSGILKMDAQVTIDAGAADRLLRAAPMAPERVILPESGCCQGD